MKYISLDIETTGLDPKKNQIVEVGAVLDEIGSTTPIEELPKFRAVLIHDEMVMENYCANLHRDLWVEMAVAVCQYEDTIDMVGFVDDMLPGKEHTYYCRPEVFETLFHNWIGKNYLGPFSAEQMRNNLETIKINVAGKNPGTFDIPFLEALPGWQGLVKFRRRVLDPASHCIQPDDEHIPDLQECLKRCGLEGTVNHTAVNDAIDVIRVIRQQRIGVSKIPTNRREFCFNCGGSIVGDGYTQIFHCENADVPLDSEPDGAVILCDKNKE